MSDRLAYRPDLDGLRALAVVPVVLFHLGVPGVSGGFVGVDVFFVLSGFFITRLLAADLERGTFSLFSFYDRRIRRIFPALALVLAFCAIAAALILSPDDLVAFGKTLTAAGFAATNISFAREAGYFAPNAEMSPLLHTWSLAVEEQFYLLFPPVLWMVWRWSDRKPALFIWLALVVSLTLSIVGVWLKPHPTFYLLPTRAWELLVGSVLAFRLGPEANAAWQREAGAAAGVMAILFAVVFYSRDIDFPGLAAVAPCAGAALVIWAGIGRKHEQTWTGRLLASRMPVFIGLVSYSLYLWHWPLIVFAKILTQGDLTPLMQVLIALGATSAAVLSWRYVEKPLRAGGYPWPSPRHRYWSACLGLLAFALAGAGLVRAHGLPQRWSPAERELFAGAQDFSQLRSRCHADGSARWTFDHTCVLGASVPPRIIVFADSHGAELSFALGEAAKARNMSVRQVTASGCPPAVGFTPRERPECAKYVDAALRAISAAPPSTVVLAAYYFNWMQNDAAGTFRSGFAQTVKTLRKAGHSVIIVGAVPNHPGGQVPSALARWVYYSNGSPAGYRFTINRSVASDIESYLRRIATETGATFIPLSPISVPRKRNASPTRTARSCISTTIICPCPGPGRLWQTCWARLFGQSKHLLQSRRPPIESRGS